MPAFVVAMTKGDDGGESIVAIDDEGEVTHGFVAFVDGDGEGDVGAGVETVLGDEISVSGPCWVNLMHPANVFRSLGDHHKGFFYRGIVCDILGLFNVVASLPWSVFEDMYDKEDEDGNEDENAKDTGDCIWSSRPDHDMYELKKT